jgi:hypothetical protein
MALWDEGSFYLAFIQSVYCFSKAFMHSLRSSLNTFLAKKKVLSPRGGERGDLNSKNDFQNRDNRKPSKKQFTNRLSLRPSAQSNAPLITMTGEGGAEQLKSRQLTATPQSRAMRQGALGR